MKKNILKPKVSDLRIILCCLIILQFLATALVFGEDFEELKTFDKITNARLAVERAWETYHHAALGGTLASPNIQTELEINLHKSRALLAKAYDAENKGDVKIVNNLVVQIMNIAQHVITESREPKK